MNLTVELLAKTGSFSTDMQRSAKDLERLKKEALATGQALGGSLKDIAAAAGFTLSVGALSGLIKTSIDAADHLNDLSKKTGIAVDTLGGIGFAAEQAGGDLNSAAAAIGKFNKTIAEATAGNREAQEFFSALGLSVKDSNGNIKDAGLLLGQVADKFAEFEDGPNKAALALRGFGKAGADIIPLLNEGGKKLQENIEYYKRYSGVTQRVADDADQFNDSLVKLGLLTKSFGTTLSAELLPTLQSVVDEFLRMKEQSGGAGLVVSGIRVAFEALTVLGANVAFTFEGVGRDVKAIGQQLVSLAKLDFEGFTAISDAVKADSKRARAELDAFERRVLGLDKDRPIFSDARFDASRGAGKKKKKGAPGLPGGGADAELKKRLDGQIKAIREFADQQRDAYAFGQTFVDAVLKEGTVSLQEGFAAQGRVRDAALQATVAGLDNEIAALTAHKAKVKGVEGIETDNKIAEATAKRAAAVLKGSQDAIIANLREEQSTKQLADSYNDLRATVLQLSGDEAGAAAIRNAKQIEEARRLITQQKGDPALLEQLSARLGQTTALSQVQREYNQLLERARVAEEQLILTQQTGGATELETMEAIGALRQKSLSDMAALVQKAQELAKALGSPEAALFGDQLALSLRRATVEADPLLVRVRELGREVGDTIASGFEDAIVQGKGLRSVLDGIAKDLLRLTIRENFTKPLAEQLGGSGGWLSALAGLFGGGTADFGMGSGSGIVGLPTRGGAATGTNFVERDMLTILHKGEAVIPKPFNPRAVPGGSGGGGNVTVVNHVTVQSGVSRNEVMAAMEITKRQTISDIAELRRRGNPNFS